MCEFNLAFYIITLAILWSQPFCKGATHWIVTEDGRIQQQADSIFNLKSPYDLVTFIHQQSAFDRLKILREDYLEEKRKVIEAREKEREEIQKSFFKVDPDCVDAGKHISEFELHLEMTLPFGKKGINIPDHVNLCQPLPSHLDPPYCRTELPTVIYSYDHLEGVNGRYQLNTSAEPMLLSGFSSYFKTVEELGGRVSLALERNSSSWVLLNLAAYYWRIKGNALEAVDCLRQALYFSPREHKDHALMSLAAVLHHTNHSHDSLVLFHTAIDTGNELSVYHFLLGNIYASMKLYEMAELCHRFTLVVSPDTDSLCERVKAVRCELKLKELLHERQLDFNETLDSLKTPELDLTKELSSEAVAKKQFLPLETYKKQLEHVYTTIQGVAKQIETCNSRPGPTKHDLHLSFDHAAAKEKHAGQVKRKEAEKSAHRQDDGKHGHQTDNTSSGIQGKTLEKSMIITEDVKTTSNSEISSQKSSDTNNEESENSIEKESGKISETLDATNSQSDNSNISMEEKTMQNLEEARLALKRLKSIIKTVSQARHSALNTVDVAEEKSSQSDSDIDSEDGANIAPSKVSSIKSTQTVVVKQSTVQKAAGNPRRMGRRGESGLKMPKSDSGRREDNANTVILEETKFAKQKGESVVMNKNGPGLKLDKMASKDTREISDAELLFEEPKGSHPFGPKHTPPLKNKDLLVRAKKCQNVGRKKRKGEAFAMECLTQDASTQTQGSTTEGDLPIQKSVTKTDFSKSATNSEQTESDLSQLQSNTEAVLMKQTLAEEISTTTSSNANASDLSSDAEVHEKSERNTSSVDDVVKSVTKDDKSVNGKENDETPPKSGVHSDSKAVEKSESKVSTENVMKSIADDKENDSEKSNGESSRNSDEKIKMKAATKDGVKIKPSDNESEMKQNDEVASKNSDAKVLEKSELKISAVEDDGKSKTNDKEVKNFKEPSLENEKSEMKSYTAGNVKSKSSDNGNKNLKQHERATSGKNCETINKGHKSTSSKPNTEQTDTDSKSGKTINSDKAAQNIKEKIEEAEFLHRVGAGSNVFETSFLNVHTSGSLHELSDEECKHIDGVHALVIRNKQFSAWLSLDTKNIDVRTHVDFLSEVDDLPKKPRCTANIKNNLHTFGNLQGMANADKLDQVAEAGLTQTLLAIGRTIQDSVDEMGTRIYNALKKNSTSWVILNIASLYWRVQGDTAEAIKCLRQALYFSPPDARDVAHVGLASILLREGHLDDTAVVIKKALEISPSLALGHFILGNVFGAQSNIPEAIQHYLLALQLEPGFTPAVERLKIIQCVLWKQQQALEKEANDLRKLLNPN